MEHIRCTSRKEFVITTLTGRVVTAHTTYPHARITLVDGVIHAVEALDGSAPADAPTIVPGFIDLHNHGAFPNGSPAEVAEAIAYHRGEGTTTLVASLVSATEQEILDRLEVLAPFLEEGQLAGVHLEGPFLNALRCGAQAPDRITPGDPDMLRRVIDRAKGAIRQVTLAPETPRIEELIEVCAAENVIVSLGHSDADFQLTTRVIEHARACGATVTATHLFNAMPQIHHRAPGIAAALLAAASRAEVYLELIADSVHLADNTVDTVLAATREAQSAFAVTDAMAAAGKPDGDYVLGPLAVTVANGVARLTEGGAIAGGTSTLREQFSSISARHGEQEAVRMTSTTPAAVLGAGSRLGDIAPGQQADLVVFAPGPGHIVEEVIVKGIRKR